MGIKIITDSTCFNQKLTFDGARDSCSDRCSDSHHYRVKTSPNWFSTFGLISIIAAVCFHL